MKENFWWLFAAYAVIWLAIYAYVVKLQGQQAKMRRDLAHLEKQQNSSAQVTTPR